MYYLLVYDVDVSKVNKIYKYLKRYMNWIQNSVFEGELGDADFLEVKKKLNQWVDKETDSILIFKFRDKHSFEKEVIGRERNELSNIL
ncbi:MAG TPA: CRISPR-associated endonuclease Cas2 [Candidatus Nanoarchaeia archaeon]|nr:CRISPR-associated endonuclease Cas2 [Candidatus Nanoarchaeia archaeon]